MGNWMAKKKKKPKKKKAKTRKAEDKKISPYNLGILPRKSYKLEKVAPLIITLLLNGQSVRQACTLVSITQQAYYDYKRKNKKFKAEAEEAVKSRIEMVEDSLFEDCMIPKQVDAKKFYLKNRKPKSWSDTVKQEHHINEIPQINFVPVKHGKHKRKAK